MSAADRDGRHAWLALTPLLVGTFTGTVNNSIVNVPMAEILDDLDVPLSNGALIVVAFNLAFAVLMPLSGWLGDRLGRRRTFCAAMVLLAAGAAGSALAPNLSVLVGFRVLQGVATAAVLPGVMSLIASMFGNDRRGRALGFWAAVNGAGQAAGPALGGLLAGWVGWRAIFWPTVPLAFLALALTLWLVPRDPARPVPLEWRGAGLLTLSAAELLFAASAVAPLGVSSPWVWGVACFGVVTAVGYLLVERGRADAFLPPGLLRESRYLRSSLAVLAQMFCLGATLLGVPLYLVQRHGVSTAAAGLLVLALPVAMMVFAPLAGLATERLTPRIALRSGLAVLVAGELLLAVQLGAGRAPDSWLVITLALAGAGVAFVQTPAAAGATRSRAGQRGAGLGLFNSLRFGGSALGASWVAAAGGTEGAYGLVFGVCVGVAVLGLLGSFAGEDPATPAETAADPAAAPAADPSDGVEPSGDTADVAAER
ncbi:MAG TPA: MFS transporter [Nocardioidaceae bacterium]|nr:MFS transporter [Nocardioidaceae bacterium]